MIAKHALPPSSCPLGYTEADLKGLLGEINFPIFRKWMYGQTMALCDGLYYDQIKGAYEKSGCYVHPHGAVVYGWDLERFLAGKPVID